MRLGIRQHLGLVLNKRLFKTRSCYAEFNENRTKASPRREERHIAKNEGAHAGTRKSTLTWLINHSDVKQTLPRRRSVVELVEIATGRGVSCPYLARVQQVPRENARSGRCAYNVLAYLSARD